MRELPHSGTSGTRVDAPTPSRWIKVLPDLIDNALAEAAKEMGAKVDRVDEVSRLIKESRSWTLKEAIPHAIAGALKPDEAPLVVLAVRDVWISNSRLVGTNPYVCVTDKRLYCHNYAKRNKTSQYETIDRGSVVSISPLDKRRFEISLLGGGTCTIRGLTGSKKDDEKFAFLYEVLRGSVTA
jgi:hypothetical protein